MATRIPPATQGSVHEKTVRDSRLVGDPAGPAVALAIDGSGHARPPLAERTAPRGAHLGGVPGGSFATPGECSRSYRAGKTKPDLDERSPSRCSDSLVDRVEHRALISSTLAPRSRSPWTPIATSCRGCRGVRPTPSTPYSASDGGNLAATWRQRSASGRAAGGVSAARLHSALVAQWREQRFPKPRVAGSIPAEGTRSTCGNASRRDRGGRCCRHFAVSASVVLVVVLVFKAELCDLRRDQRLLSAVGTLDPEDRLPVFRRLVE